MHNSEQDQRHVVPSIEFQELHLEHSRVETHDTQYFEVGFFTC
jgi:hypothetical protein